MGTLWYFLKCVGLKIDIIVSCGNFYEVNQGLFQDIAQMN